MKKEGMGRCAKRHPGKGVVSKDRRSEYVEVPRG